MNMYPRERELLAMLDRALRATPPDNPRRARMQAKRAAFAAEARRKAAKRARRQRVARARTMATVNRFGVVVTPADDNGGNE